MRPLRQRPRDDQLGACRRELQSTGPTAAIAVPRQHTTLSRLENLEKISQTRGNFDQDPLADRSSLVSKERNATRSGEARDNRSGLTVCVCVRACACVCVLLFRRTVASEVQSWRVAGVIERPKKSGRT